MASRGVPPTPRPKPSGLPFHAHFTDVAREAGLKAISVSGHSHHCDYIIAAMSSGAAFFDYNNDGWLDALVLSGSGFGDPPLYEIVKACPRDADARLLLGSILVEEGKRSESIAQLSKAVRLRPDSAKAQNALDEALNAFGNPQAAFGHFDKAAALDPGFAPAQVNLGSVLLKSGEYSPAKPHLDRAIRF